MPTLSGLALGKSLNLSEPVPSSVKGTSDICRTRGKDDREHHVPRKCLLHREKTIACLAFHAQLEPSLNAGIRFLN